MSDNDIRSLLKVSVATEDETPTHFDHVKFLSEGEKFVSVTEDSDVYEGNLILKSVKKIFSLPSKCSSILTYDDDSNKMCVFGMVSGSFVKYNLETKESVGSHAGIGEAASYLCKHPWSDRMLASLKHSAIIWDISSGTLLPLQRLNTYTGVQLQRAYFGLNGDTIITCFVDGGIYTWDFPSLKFQYHIDTGFSHLTCSAISDVIFAAVNESSKLFILTLSSLAEQKTFTIPEVNEGVQQIQLSELINPKNNQKKPIVAVLTISRNLYFIDLENYSLLATYKKNSQEPFIGFEIGKYLKEVRKHPLAGIRFDGSLEIFDIKNIAKRFVKSETHKSIAKPDNIVNDRKPQELIKPLNAKKAAPEKSIELTEFRQYLQSYGEFPSKYRIAIWRQVLQLPLNKQAFATLMKRGLHPAYSNLERRFPVADEKLLKALKKILSAFAHWCPLFAQVSYFPIMVFPFVSVLHENILVCFEVIMTYLVNWCHDWFQLYPAPPLEVMAKIERHLEIFAPELLSHFTGNKVTMRIYIWPLLESSFSDVFTTDEWCRVWDHIFTSHQAEFLYAVTAAYSIASKNSLLVCKEVSSFERYFGEKNPVPIESILQEADNIFQKASLKKKREFVYLTKNTYPPFTNFPLAVIQNHAQHREKIREMEADYMKKKKETALLEAEFGGALETKSEWLRKEAMLQAVEELRQQEIVLEEKKLLEQRSRLQLQRKSQWEQELRILEGKKRSLQDEYIRRRKEDLVRMKDNARWMATFRDVELTDEENQADIRNYQMQMDQCLYEIKLLEIENAKKLNADKIEFSDESGTLQTSSDHSSLNGHNFSSQSSSVSKDEDLSFKLKELEDHNNEMEDEIKSLIRNLEIIS